MAIQSDGRITSVLACRVLTSIPHCPQWNAAREFQVAHWQSSAANAVSSRRERGKKVWLNSHQRLAVCDLKKPQPVPGTGFQLVPSSNPKSPKCCTHSADNKNHKQGRVEQIRGATKSNRGESQPLSSVAGAAGHFVLWREAGLSISLNLSFFFFFDSWTKKKKDSFVLAFENRSLSTKPSSSSAPALSNHHAQS